MEQYENKIVGSFGASESKGRKLNGGAWLMEFAEKIVRETLIKCRTEQAHLFGMKTGRWSQEEHRAFLAGLERLGRGDWKGIASKYVPTRTSLQVANHARQYFKSLAATRAGQLRPHPPVRNLASASAENANPLAAAPPALALFGSVPGMGRNFSGTTIVRVLSVNNHDARCFCPGCLKNARAGAGAGAGAGAP